MKGKREKLHIELSICSSLWFSKTLLKISHKNITEKTCFLISSITQKYSQLFIIHSNKGKPQYEQSKNSTWLCIWNLHVRQSNKSPITLDLSLLNSTCRGVLVKLLLTTSIHIDFSHFLPILWLCSSHNTHITYFGTFRYTQN